MPMTYSRESGHLDQIHTQLLGKGYRVLGMLSFGIECCVYEALDIDSGNKVAIKVWPSEKSIVDISCPVFRSECEKEFEIVKSLNHSNIVRVLQSDINDGEFRYLVFEYVSGASLKDWLFEHGAFSLAETVHVMTKVLEVLVYLEKNNVIHNDLKPANILVYNNNNSLGVKLIDFGNAVVERCQQYNEQRKCSPAYCAPEVLRGEMPTIKSDIYAWGLIFIECLIGRAVVYGESYSMMVNRQLDSFFVAMPECIKKSGLDFILSKAVQKEQEMRWQDALSIYRELRCWSSVLGESVVE
ncbi:serine/threonine-protein kinase [Teredinibacter sp. KSP-S5-2]|uniref:serine/threonine-protein kinase n=1 Tax=Teredinibacter sp. KSP-S5-2 TaxID=3034506 RepID=UPI0029343068|nr:serine/threonine-protein kinase [Teredinibacter sp. KSP-S5-2]WNO11739.1 serine/threonine-protein kinase [Teredinibacter sp. KSP-S5-2]